MSRYASFVLDFGRYKGRTLHDIAQVDLPYLHWVAGNVDRPGVRQEVKEYLRGGFAERAEPPRISERLPSHVASTYFDEYS
jgi:hypothetical protein